MAKFEIDENGQTFCAIEARDAAHALDLASAKFVRRRADYNLGPNDPPIQIEWWARPFEHEAPSASRMVTVPSDA